MVFKHFGIYAFFLASLLASFPVTAKAEMDIASFMKTDHGFDQNIWKIRIAATKAIAGMEENKQYGEWCTNETDRENGLHEVCAIAAEVGYSNERIALETLPTMASIITTLENMPNTDVNRNHIKVLKQQYETLDSFPIVWHDIINEIIKQSTEKRN
ncbi:MAG: hypothetical protein H6867_03505 [Rhodospirillales bacterium]|nr:hypothetical protein [Rhodospirillales bacterium]MCB9996218.1 hypothetical protein [Rhodospirillales bacterium]